MMLVESGLHVFKRVCKGRNNLHKEDAVYIGDSDVDIQTGKNACIDVISAAWGFRGKDFLLQNGAEKIAQNAQELLKMIL